MMAGDLSLAEEIRRRHEDMAGTEAAAFLVPESESDDDDEVRFPSRICVRCHRSGARSTPIAPPLFPSHRTAL